MLSPRSKKENTVFRLHARTGRARDCTDGKDTVRVFRVVRDPESKVHDVVEYNVTVLVEGAIETRCAQPPGASQSRVRRILK